MSALDGFYATWSDARNTFGEGTPQGGSQIDASPTFSRLGEDVQAAAPGDTWTGAGSEAYGGANKKHGENLTKLADLDRRLAAQLDQAADVVTTGRGNLDAVRQWVTDAANSVPPGKQRDELLMKIANGGLGQVSEIVQTSNDANNTIRDNMNRLKPEFQAIGLGKGKGEGDPLLEDLKERSAEEEARKRAEQDVKESFETGESAAVGRVEDVLGSIKPYQELTPEQSDYLDAIQSQQANMTVDELKAAKDRMGDKGHIVGDSWQLLSNDDIPRSPGDFDEQQKGGFDRLPQSVQDAIKSDGLLADRQMKDIAAIVESGNNDLQTGTELDREMMRKADRMMDANGFDGEGSILESMQPHYDEVVRDIFDSAGRDHQIVHDHISGTHGDDGEDFMMDVSTHEWGDDGKSAGSLFEWTKDAESKLAAETANVYAEFLGVNSNDLLTIDGNRQVGDINPELVKAFSTGLLPYQDELVTDQPTIDTPFHRLDDLSGSMEHTKGLFAVIDSQQDAAREWNKAAYQNALDMQQSFAAFAKDHPNMPAGDVRVDDLQASARMLGAIDGGISQETLSNIKNGEMNAQQAAENAKSAYEFKKDIIRSIFSYGPGGDLVTNTFADTFAGPPPNPKDFTFDETGAITDVGLTSNELSIGAQNTHAHYTVASQFINEGNSHVDDRFFDDHGKLKPPSQIDVADWSIYDAQLATSMAEYTQINALLLKFNTTLGQVGGAAE